MILQKFKKHITALPVLVLLVSLCGWAGALSVYKVFGEANKYLDGHTQSWIIDLTRTTSHITEYQKAAKAYFLNPTKAGKEELKLLNGMIRSRQSMIEPNTIKNLYPEVFNKMLEEEFDYYNETLSSLNIILSAQGLLETEQKKILGHLRSLDASISYIYTESYIGVRNAALTRQASLRDLLLPIIVLITFLALSIVFLTKFLIKIRRQSATLTSNENRLHSLISSSPVCIKELDLDGKLVSINPSGLKIMGVENASEILGLNYLDIPISEDRERVSVLMDNARQGRGSTFEFRTVGKNSILHFLSSFEPIYIEDGSIVRLMGVTQDITDRKQSEEKLHTSEQRFSSLVQSQSDFIARFTPDGTLSFVNDSYISFMGKGKSDLLGHYIYDDIPPKEHESVKANLSQLSIEKLRKTHENTVVSATGECRIIEWISHGVFDSSQTLIEIQSVGRDMTNVRESQNEVLRAHEKLEHLAHFDSLTDLPNRVLLADRLNHAMVQCHRRGQALAVAYMDLDGFKVVNDTYGHDLGDKLLVELSKRMKKSLREGDTLARIGGDEFIAIMVDLKNIKGSEPILERLLKTTAEPVTVDDTVVQVSMSIGVTLYPQDGVDADQLIRHADQAMYAAKQSGKNRYQLFDTDQDSAIKIQQKSIVDVRSALGRREFVLHYQPKVNMHTGEVIGVEALIRWQHPVRGLVPPLEFIPALEGHAISLELGEWVIDTALIQISQWRSIGLELPISVNISAYQLQQGNFTTRLKALLEAHPEIDPHYLELEVLESGELSDISQVCDTMNACHELGVRFSLDDFGTGYSSLAHIKRLPAYMIKIDQSFVRDMLEDIDDLAIVESVVGLAKGFKRKVIAEGVETISHGVALLELGCELAQGYGIARPMPADDIPEWVSNWKTDDSWQGIVSIEANQFGPTGLTKSAKRVFGGIPA
jgi:diguanylate cyclase (GGDEF)-like protein/PAS domain S-box-containing protein